VRIVEAARPLESLADLAAEAAERPREGGADALGDLPVFGPDGTALDPALGMDPGIGLGIDPGMGMDPGIDPGMGIDLGMDPALGMDPGMDLGMGIDPGIDPALDSAPGSAPDPDSDAEQAVSGHPGPATAAGGATVRPTPTAAAYPRPSWQLSAVDFSREKKNLREPLQQAKTHLREVAFAMVLARLRGQHSAVEIIGHGNSRVDKERAESVSRVLTGYLVEALTALQRALPENATPLSVGDFTINTKAAGRHPSPATAQLLGIPLSELARQATVEITLSPDTAAPLIDPRLPGPLRELPLLASVAVDNRGDLTPEAESELERIAYEVATTGLRNQSAKVTPLTFGITGYGSWLGSGDGGAKFADRASRKFSTYLEKALYALQRELPEATRLTARNFRTTSKAGGDWPSVAVADQLHVSPEALLRHVVVE
ncbi:hypothetical protein ACWD25_24595, partial [Streptomyces sp. NPDC002920]